MILQGFSILLSGTVLGLHSTSHSQPLRWKSVEPMCSVPTRSVTDEQTPDQAQSQFSLAAPLAVAPGLRPGGRVDDRDPGLRATSLVTVNCARHQTEAGNVWLRYPYDGQQN